MFDRQLEELTAGVNVRANLIHMKEALQGGGNTEELKGEKRYGISLFPAFLDSPDAKVRKNAVLIMGLLGEEGYGDIIAKRYEKEETLFVRSAYLTALKAYDYENYLEMLRNRRRELEAGGYGEGGLKHAAEELRALTALLDAGKERVKHKFTDPSKPVQVILTAAAIHREALSEALARNGITGAKPVFCGLAVRTAEVYRAAHIRIYNELLFPLNGMKSYAAADIPLALAGGNIAELLGTLHKNSGGAFAFRLDAGEAGAGRNGTGKIDAGRLAARIQAALGGRLVNSVSDYEIEIKLIAARDGKYGMFLKLHTFGFDRFGYRSEAVAASVNPVKAAMAVWLVRDYLKQGADVLDPFCGVGTLLIERNKLVKAGRMYGTDTFGRAIEGARKNTGKAGIKINYINRDYYDFEHSLIFDEIITDMPVLEHREADVFYGRFLKCSEGHLKDGGIMIVYSSEKNLLKKHLRLNGSYKLLREFPMDSRGDAGVYVLMKHTGEE